MADESGGPIPGRLHESGREESEEERADRNLSDLLQELRVALPGVQVLFAFLLTVPFTQRFDEPQRLPAEALLRRPDRVALATVMLVAPTAGHRILFRRQQKEFIVTLSNNLALIGLLLLAISMCGVVAADQRLPVRERRPRCSAPSGSHSPSSASGSWARS